MHKEPATPEGLRKLFLSLRQERRELKALTAKAGIRRRALTKSERRTVLRKTGRRCHICGGLIRGKWQADHVLAHSGRGTHEADNYLPAHTLCNNYRWDYLAAEFQYILKLGVWVKHRLRPTRALVLNWRNDLPLMRKAAVHAE
jgi:5-methylcytosine-specific restriction endonuclease McrA